MSIFDSIFNKTEKTPANKVEGESSQTHKEKLYKKIDAEKEQNIEVLKEEYDSLLEHSSSIGLTKSDMEEVLLSQIEKRGISPDISSEAKGPAFEFRRKLAILLEEKFGSTKLIEKIQERFGLNYHLGESMFPYVDMESYPGIAKLNSEKIYLFVESGLIKMEGKYNEEFIEKIKQEATKDFILKNINPDTIRATIQELEKISSFTKEQEIKSDIIGADSIFKEEVSPENKTINLET